MAPDENCVSLDADEIPDRCDTIIAPVESRVDSSRMGCGLLAQQGAQCRFQGRFFVSSNWYINTSFETCEGFTL